MANANLDESFDSQASTVLLPSDTESEAIEWTSEEDDSEEDDSEDEPVASCGAQKKQMDELSSDDDSDHNQYHQMFVPKLKRHNAVIIKKNV